MHDQFGVSVCNRIGNLEEQLQPCAQRQTARLAVNVDGLARYVFEREEGLAVVGDAGVVQRCDVRMIEGCKDLALARHSFGEQGRAPGSMRQLQCDRSVQQAIGTLGEPDCAHAAGAELSYQSIAPDDLVLCTGLLCVADRG